MNHSVVIKLKINNFILTFPGISPRYFAVFRGEIRNLNLPVVNVKKQISPRNTAKFHREKIHRLNVKNFPWPVKFRGGFAATSDQHELCKNGFLAITPLHIYIYDSFLALVTIADHNHYGKLVCQLIFTFF